MIMDETTCVYCSKPVMQSDEGTWFHPDVPKDRNTLQYIMGSRNVMGSAYCHEPRGPHAHRKAKPSVVILPEVDTDEQLAKVDNMLDQLKAMDDEPEPPSTTSWVKLLLLESSPGEFTVEAALSEYSETDLIYKNQLNAKRYGSRTAELIIEIPDADIEAAFNPSHTKVTTRIPE